MFDIQFLCATIFPKNLDVCSFLGYNIFVIDMFFEVFSSGTFYKRKGLFYNNIGLPAASTTVPSLSVPSLRGSVPPWRAQSRRAAKQLLQSHRSRTRNQLRSLINSELSRHPRHQDRGQEHPQQKQLQRSLHQGHRGEERLTSQIKSLAPKLVILRDRGRHRLVQLRAPRGLLLLARSSLYLISLILDPGLVCLIKLPHLGPLNLIDQHHHHLKDHSKPIQSGLKRSGAQ